MSLPSRTALDVAQTWSFFRAWLYQIWDHLNALPGAYTPRGAWATATAYFVGDFMTTAGATYVCILAHTSGVFATDLAAGKWSLDNKTSLETDLAGAGASQGSQKIGHQPAGPSAVPTTLYAQARQQTSVVDAMSSAQRADYFSRAKTLDCTAAIQSVEDYIESLGGGEMFWPVGIARHDTMINRKTGVTWAGKGKNGTRAVYFGTGVAYNCVGTSGARKSISFKNMSLEASSPTNNSQCIQLGWNQRGESFKFLDSVKIAGFGHYGLNFVDANWLVQFWDMEMVQCGRNVAGSCGVYKGPGVAELAVVRFWGGAIEECGTVTSEAGGLYFDSNGTTRSAGLYLHGVDIEGNFAKNGGADMRVKRGDVFVMGSDYEAVNTTGGAGGGPYLRGNMIFDECAQASLYGVKFGNQPAFASYAVQALNGTNLYVDPGCEPNQNNTSPGGGDIYADATSTVRAPNVRHRLQLPTPASTVVYDREPRVVAMAKALSGVLQPKSHNIASITNPSTGRYDVVMVQAQPDTHYLVDSDCENLASFTSMETTCALILSSNSFTIYTLNNDVQPPVLANCRQLMFKVTAQQI